MSHPLTEPMNRRDFVYYASGSASVLLAGCLIPDDVSGKTQDSAHLTARPVTPSETPLPGKQPLGLSQGRDGFIYIPPAYSPTKPAALVVLLHGAGRSSAEWAAAPLDALFGARNIVAVAPDSRASSWDLRYGGFGPDVKFIDRALELAFKQCAINPERIALGGFSDGASYALSLGVTNGDLFNAVMGFSPGFYLPDRERGKPRLFVSHGTKDDILPFETTSQSIVPRLITDGYSVKFVQFDGGHTVSFDVATQAMDWFISGSLT
jgi:phospholipase/carboxylesterase